MPRQTAFMTSANTIATRLSAIRSAIQRDALLVETLSTRPAEAAADIVSEWAKAPFANDAFTMAINGLVAIAIDNKLDATHLEAMCFHWRNTGARVLADALAAKETPPPQNMRIESSQPLGFRKSLARTHDRAVLDRVLRDPHPSVVEIFLGNPHVRENDVLRVAALRPNYHATLQTVAAHNKWRKHYRIRRALFFNPSTPTPVALPLALTLREVDLRTAPEVGLSAQRAALSQAMADWRRTFI